MKSVNAIATTAVACPCALLGWCLVAHTALAQPAINKCCVVPYLEVPQAPPGYNLGCARDVLNDCLPTDGSNCKTGTGGHSGTAVWVDAYCKDKLGSSCHVIPYTGDLPFYKHTFTTRCGFDPLNNQECKCLFYFQKTEKKATPPKVCTGTSSSFCK